MPLLEIAVPLLGASLAVVASVLKTWLTRKSQSEIVINLGDGSTITLDGSEEYREKVRKVLFESFGLRAQSDQAASPSSTSSPVDLAARDRLDRVNKEKDPSER